MAGRKGGVSIKRKRNTLDGVFEVTFRDPRRWQDPKNPTKGRKVVRKSLRTNDLGLAKKYKDDLERLINNRNLWTVPPADIPLVVREIWLGARADVQVATKHGEIRLPWSTEAERPTTLEVNASKHFIPVADDDAEWPGFIQVELPYPEAAKTLTVAEAYKLAVAEVEDLRKAYERQALELKDVKEEKAALELKLRRYNKRAAKAAKVGTLLEEAQKYLADYDARKLTKRRKGIMKNTVDRFVQAMGPRRQADDISESEVNRYVQSYRASSGKAIGEERRKEIRQSVCTLMAEVTHGVFDRRRVKSISAHSVSRERRNPVYLTKTEATRLVAKMYELHGNYWGDFAKVQLYQGWRPTELGLLQKKFVTAKHVELVPVKDETSGVSHGKTGARSIQIHPAVKSVIVGRLKDGSSQLLFPFPNPLGRRRIDATGVLAEAWDQGVLSKQYPNKLRSAAKAAKIQKPVEARTLRRTFGSLGIRSGLSVEEVSVLLGNRPQTVRRHYARLLPNEVKLDAVSFTSNDVS